MKRLYFIANWKSYKTTDEATDWLKGISNLKSQISNLDDKEIIVCPTYTLIPSMYTFLKENNLPIKLATQDISPFGEGSYTSAVNVKQVAEFVTHVLVGHSERRKYFHETDDDVIAKVKIVVENNLTPILCVSDMAQMNYYLKNGRIIIDNADKIIFVYEPPGAISGGGAFKKVSIEEANRNAGEISKKIGKKVITAYGASVNIENVGELCAQKNIDGCLVGQASLNPDSFIELIKNS